jgi:hypothetical protein
MIGREERKHIRKIFFSILVVLIIIIPLFLENESKVNIKIYQDRK